MKIINKKFIKYSALSCGALIALAGLLSLFLWWNGIRKDSPVEKVGEITLLPSGDKFLGSAVEVSMLFKAPWHRHVSEVSVIPGKGSQLVDKPSWRVEKIRPGYCIWKVSAELQPFRTGMIPSGTMEVAFNKRENSKSAASFKFNTPSFNVKPLDAGKSPELALAGKSSAKAKISNAMLLAILAGCGLLLAGILIAADMIRRARKALPPLPTAWELALCEIENTSSSLKSGSITPMFCFGKLTDIVRSYLVKRFRLRATVQTTYEFLNDLKRPASPLNEHQKYFLQDFLTSADLVKFAALPPDTVILEDMLGKAATLVRETIPNEEPAKKEGHKK